MMLSQIWQHFSRVTDFIDDNSYRKTGKHQEKDYLTVLK